MTKVVASVAAPILERLPTEAEWEYACRAGAETEYCFGDDAKRLDSYCEFQNASTDVTASNMCNRWGLFDMHGNVWQTVVCCRRQESTN